MVQNRKVIKRAQNTKIETKIKDKDLKIGF